MVDLHLENAAWIWVPFLIIFTLAAWFFMNDLSASKASLSAAAGAEAWHLWIMALLYLATFGSFIGFSAGFAMLSKTSFRMCRSCITPSSARLSARWRVRGRGDLRPSGRDPRDAGELRGDGYLCACCS
jgi:nitrate/nitrite transporter NarK